MEVIEAPSFSKLLAEYLSDEDYRELQLHLASDPEAGDVIQGTGGFRMKAAVEDENGRRARRRASRRE